jgi:hypothetical protein
VSELTKSVAPSTMMKSWSSPFRPTATWCQPPSQTSTEPWIVSCVPAEFSAPQRTTLAPLPADGPMDRRAPVAAARRVAVDVAIEEDAAADPVEGRHLGVHGAVVRDDRRVVRVRAAEPLLDGERARADVGRLLRVVDRHADRVPARRHVAERLHAPGRELRDRGRGDGQEGRQGSGNEAHRRRWEYHSSSRLTEPGNRT